MENSHTWTSGCWVSFGSWSLGYRLLLVFSRPSASAVSGQLGRIIFPLSGFPPSKVFSSLSSSLGGLSSFPCYLEPGRRGATPALKRLQLPSSTATKQWGIHSAGRLLQVLVPLQNLPAFVQSPEVVLFVFSSEFIAVIHRRMGLLSIYPEWWLLLCLDSVAMTSVTPGLCGPVHTAPCWHPPCPPDCLSSYTTGISPGCSWDPVSLPQARVTHHIQVDLLGWTAGFFRTQFLRTVVCWSWLELICEKALLNSQEFCGLVVKSLVAWDQLWWEHSPHQG